MRQHRNASKNGTGFMVGPGLPSNRESLPFFIANIHSNWVCKLELSKRRLVSRVSFPYCCYSSSNSKKQCKMKSVWVHEQCLELRRSRAIAGSGWIADALPEKK